MSTIVLPDLLRWLMDGVSAAMDKAMKTEMEIGAADPLCLAFVWDTYREVMGG